MSPDVLSKITTTIHIRTGIAMLHSRNVFGWSLITAIPWVYLRLYVVPCRDPSLIARIMVQAH